MPYQKEHNFVYKLAQQLFIKMTGNFGGILTTKIKADTSDFLTRKDLALDKYIVQEIKRTFPKDIIVTEESSSFLLPKAKAGWRAWIVDPLCGSLNYSRSLPIFNTNIMLAERGKIVAAWVVDYPLHRLIWSIGNGVYLDRKKLPRLKSPKYPWLIEVDNNAYTKKLPKIQQQRFAKVAHDLILQPNILFRGFNSSLVFAYVATGQIQGDIVMRVQAWDLLAACFLVGQNGGRVTHFDNTPWNLSSRAIIIAQNKVVHQVLLKIVQKNGLAKFR